MKGLIAKKVGMTQIFDESGNLTPVTVIQVEPNVVVAKKTKENCGYDAVVLGLDDLKASKANKAYAGQFPENINPKRHLKEFRNYEKEVNVGDVREVIKKVVNISKSKVNFTLLNKILKKHEEIDLVLNNAMNKNILYGTRTLKNNTRNNSSKFKLEVKDDINLFPKDKKTKNCSYISIIDEEISQRINTLKIVNKTKNVINKGNQGKEMLIIDNDIKEKNKNKNNEYTFQKLKAKKFIKEQIPQDKIKTNDKSKNKNSRPNVYNISIGNIKNIQNNIKIILKDKNKIVVSKVEKPKLGKLKQLKLDMSGINIDNKKKVKNGINETNPFDIFTENNIKFSRSNVLKTEHINTSKSINLNSNLNNSVDKKPLDKNEYEIKGIKNRN